MKKFPFLVIILLVSLGAVYAVYAGREIRQSKAVPATVNVELLSMGICGDQNGDGTVNIFDVIINLQIIVGQIEPTPEQLRLSDVVRDGQINIFDVILTLQHIVGLNEITECGPLPG